MTVLQDALGAVASWAGANGLPIATIATVLVVLAYGRRTMKVGGTLASWVRTFFIVVLAIAVLAALGVVSIHVEPIVDGVRWALTSLVELLAGLSLQAAPAGPPDFVADLLGSLGELIGSILDGPADVLGNAIDAVTSAGA